MYFCTMPSERESLPRDRAARCSAARCAAGLGRDLEISSAAPIFAAQIIRRTGHVSPQGTYLLRSKVRFGTLLQGGPCPLVQRFHLTDTSCSRPARDARCVTGPSGVPLRSAAANFRPGGPERGVLSRVVPDFRDVVPYCQILKVSQFMFSILLFPLLTGH